MKNSRETCKVNTASFFLMLSIASNFIQENDITENPTQVS